MLGVLSFNAIRIAPYGPDGVEDSRAVLHPVLGRMWAEDGPLRATLEHRGGFEVPADADGRGHQVEVWADLKELGLGFGEGVGYAVLPLVRSLSVQADEMGVLLEGEEPSGAMFKMLRTDEAPVEMASSAGAPPWWRAGPF